MVGCRHNAKNTLPKNYLWFAERAGVEILPERTVADVKPLGAPDGSGGYAVTSEHSGAWFRKRPQHAHRARRRRRRRPARHQPAAPALPPRRLAAAPLRAASATSCAPTREAISAVTTTDDRHDFTRSIAITSSFYPDPDTHIENVTYGPGADSIALLFTKLKAAARTKLTHPLLPRRWSRRTVILLTMQTLDNSMRLIPKRNLFGPGPRLQTQEDPDKPNPRFIEVADTVTRRAAEKLDAVPQAGLTEALLNIPTTAHIMGGAVIGASPETGVIDEHQRAFGYENLLVCDGAAIPANIGVNPSLTITAMAERAMSHVAPREQPAAPSAPRRRHSAAAPVIPRQRWRAREVRPEARRDRRHRGRRRDGADLVRGQRAAPRPARGRRPDHLRRRRRLPARARSCTSSSARARGEQPRGRGPRPPGAARRPQRADRRHRARPRLGIAGGAYCAARPRTLRQPARSRAPRRCS